MSANDLNINGLTIAEAPAIDIITHELTGGAPTNLTTVEQDLIHDRIIAALCGDTSRVVVIFMPGKMKTEADDRRFNVGVTAAGGKILTATNNLLIAVKGDKTLVVHFIASCSFDTQPEIVAPPEEDESVIGYQGGENSGEDSGDETTLGGDETTLEPPTPSNEAESSFESYTGHGFTQEMW